ncbi:MAG TPA: LapA family protein [Burkholderiaceae bacterium]|jgi:putative membrane protein|nr:LapA family protein [Burkholderiaceae bacterium]
MDLIGWLLRLIFFILALWFALQNTVPVPLRLSPTQGWSQVPLVVVILACFVAGAVAGMLALVPYMVRQRRRIALLSRAGGQQPQTGNSRTEIAAESLTDVARRVGAVGGLDTETRTRQR